MPLDTVDTAQYTGKNKLFLLQYGGNPYLPSEKELRPLEANAGGLAGDWLLMSGDALR